MERGREARPWLRAALVALVLVLTAAAVVADLHHLSALATAADVVAGLAFCLAAASSARPDAQRLLILLVGLAWLLGSSLPVAWLYRPVLVVALLAFPVGRLVSRPVWAVAVVGTVALAVTAQDGGWAGWGVAVLAFAAVAVVRWPGLPRLDWRAYPVVGSAVIALASAASAASLARVGFSVVPGFWSIAYPAVLTLVALGHVPASRMAWAERLGRMAERDTSETATGDPLQHSLRRALDDEALRVVILDPAVGAVDADEQLASVDRILVRDGDLAIAVVESSNPLLRDPATAAQVVQAVQLTVRARRQQDERRARLAELQAARTRLLEASDAEQAMVAERLHVEVLPQLRAAIAALEGLDDGEALAVVREELQAAQRDLDRLVEGVPPADLGHGRLVVALEEVARRTTLPFVVEADPGWGCAPGTEQDLYYVACEAIANVLKHASATSVILRLRREGEQMLLEVRDDGRGGARLGGSGLQGLADRVVARGGTMQLSSPPGGGTVLVARVPRA